MNKLSILIILIILSLPGIGLQDSKPTKEERKKAEKIKAEESLVEFDSLLASKKYIFQGKFQSIGGGPRRSINPSLNYLKIDGNKCVLQAGSDYLTGYGDSVMAWDCEVVKYERGRDRKNINCTVDLEIVAEGEKLSISLNVNSDNYARMVVVNTGVSPAMYGTILPLDKADYFEGRKVN
jgi:hypothetical protein